MLIKFQTNRPNFYDNNDLMIIIIIMNDIKDNNNKVHISRTISGIMSILHDTHGPWLWFQGYNGKIVFTYLIL